MRIWYRLVIVLSLVLLIAPVGAGCYYLGLEDPGTDPEAPFYQDRVSTVRIVMSAEDWDFCLEHPFEEQYVPADFWFDDQLVPDVGIRTKGNSSLGVPVSHDSPRMPFAVDFNLFNRARNFYGLKKVFLNNGWSDPTLVREVITYRMFADFGLPAPRATLVDFYINDLHMGVYTMVEMVDQTFINRHFVDGTGYLYKPELVAARLEWTEVEAYTPLKSIRGMAPQEVVEQDPALEINIGGAPLIELLRALDQQDMVSLYQPSPYIGTDTPGAMPPSPQPANRLEAMMLKTNENNPEYSGLFTFLDVLNNTPDETFVDEINEVLDIEKTLKFLAASAVTVHLDNYIGVGHNTYYYEVDGIVTPIVWDTNMAFGTFNMGIRKPQLINYFIDEPTTGPLRRFPLAGRLLSQPEFLEQYRGYVREFIEGPFSPDVVLPRIDAWHDILEPYVRVESQMFYSYQDWERCFTEDLRAPDRFPGWQAGGPAPDMPFFLSREEGACIWKNFKVRSLWELMNRDFTPGEMEKLENCLDEETMDIFLQNRFGPMMSPQPPRQPGFGPNAWGLKTFILARYESVRAQLAGERPSGSGRGEGNGGSMWMVDIFKQ